MAAGFAACAIAFATDSIYEIVLLADGLGTAGLAVVCVAALRSSYGGPLVATATLAGAFLTSFVLGNFTEFEAPFLASFAVALVLFIGLGAVDRHGPYAHRRSKGILVRKTREDVRKRTGRSISSS